MQYLYSFTVALFLTLALVPLLARIADKLSLTDDPGADRKLHEVVMPRIGGLAIVFGALAPLVFLLDFDRTTSCLVAACGIIVLFGLLDDRLELSYKWKLFGQALASLLVIFGADVVIRDLPFLSDAWAPQWLDYAVTFLFLIGVVNGVNFSDGMDGLAAGTSIMALLLVFLLAIQSDATEAALVSLTVVGGVLGFLRYNTYPARVFMGDAGSQFLGFVISILAVIVTQGDASPYSPLLPILILGIPVMDILQVVPVRLKKNLPLPGPDKEHFHHQVWKLGFRHYEVVAIIYVLQAALLTSAFKLRFEPDMAVAFFYLVFATIVLGVILLCNVLGWKFRGKYRLGEGAERRNKLLRRIPWFYHVSARIVALMLLVFFSITGWQLRDIAIAYHGIALAILGIGLLLLVFDGRELRHFFRFVLYASSLFFSYLIAIVGWKTGHIQWVAAYLFSLLFVLILAFRMSRKEVFSLDNQDVLILLMIVLIPLLPFGQIDQYLISKVVLTAAILLYACEFLLSKGKRAIAVAVVGQLIGLLILGSYGVFNG